MAPAHYLKARVTPQLKLSVQQAAQRQHLTESIWMRQVMIEALQRQPAPTTLSAPAASLVPRDHRLGVRLRSDDQLLLKARAGARGMSSATYVSLLVRAHLRGVAPVPQEELDALKACLTEVAKLNRFMQQVAAVTQRTGQGGRPTASEVLTMINVLTVLHQRFRQLLNTTLKSWESGHAE